MLREIAAGLTVDDVQRRDGGAARASRRDVREMQFD